VLAQPIGAVVVVEALFVHAVDGDPRGVVAIVAQRDVDCHGRGGTGIDRRFGDRCVARTRVSHSCIGHNGIDCLRGVHLGHNASIARACFADPRIARRHG
jgi:hypothetical protein